MPRLDYTADRLTLRCPECGTVLTEDLDKGRMVCGKCSWEESALDAARIIQRAVELAGKIIDVLTSAVNGRM